MVACGLKPQSGGRVKPGELQPQDETQLKPIKSPSGAAESNLHLNFAASQSRMERDQSQRLARTSNLGRPEGAFCLFLSDETWGRSCPRLYSVAALRLKTGSPPEIGVEKKRPISRTVVLAELAPGRSAARHRRSARQVGGRSGHRIDVSAAVCCDCGSQKTRTTQPLIDTASWQLSPVEVSEIERFLAENPE